MKIELPELVVCAVMKMKDGDLITGIRHYSPEMRKTLKAIYGEKYHLKVKEQGFVNQYGDFLTRERAWEIAEKNNQIRRITGPKGVLFSEDLY